MPKKFKGENSKAAEARCRIEEKKTLERLKIEKEKEDVLWEDNDKLALKKQQRKENLEKKKLEAQQKKLDVQNAYETELEQLKSAKVAVKKEGPKKVTQIQLANEKEAQIKILKEKAIRPSKIVQPIELEENVNCSRSNEVDARTIEHALSLLSTQEIELDRHPEKRVKAAYAMFEELNLPNYKAEYPSMRLAQLKHMLKKEWVKSPDNPLNQHKMAKAALEYQENISNLANDQNVNGEKDSG